MKEVKRQLSKKVNTVQKFDIEIESTEKEARKKKCWIAPGTDGIQNYWWKNFEPAQKALTKTYVLMKTDNTLIPMWWLKGRTVLLPKTKNLSDKKTY